MWGGEGGHGVVPPTPLNILNSYTSLIKTSLSGRYLVYRQTELQVQVLKIFGNIEDLFFTLGIILVCSPLLVAPSL